MYRYEHIELFQAFNKLTTMFDSVLLNKKVTASLKQKTGVDTQFTLYYIHKHVVFVFSMTIKIVTVFLYIKYFFSANYAFSSSCSSTRVHIR